MCFFDLETTGVNITSDRIVEISILKVFPNGKEERHTWKVNPEMPIPPETTAQSMPTPTERGPACPSRFQRQLG